MNWDNPAERLALIERVGPQEYNRQIQQHHKDTTVETVGGHDIRPVNTRFGRLFNVGATGVAFPTLEKARSFAESNPVEA